MSATREEGRYSRVSRRVWNDAGFNRLSAAKPNAQSLLFRLLFGPELGCIPGLFPMREGGMAEALGWPVKAFRKCFEEVIQEGMARFDGRAGLCWLPNALKHNEPASPNVIKSWALAWKELPECELKDEAELRMLEWADAKGKPWGEAMRKAFGKASTKDAEKPSRKPSSKPCPNQDQDQEQDPKATEVIPSSPGHGGGPRQAAAAIEPTITRCPPDLDLLEAQKANLEMAGAQRWQVDAMVLEIRTKLLGSSDRKTPDGWRSYLAGAVTRRWSNPAERPQKLPSEAGAAVAEAERQQSAEAFERHQRKLRERNRRLLEETNG